MKSTRKYMNLIYILIFILLSMQRIFLFQSLEKKIEIKSEFSNFLKKFKSNSCVMEVFSYSQKKCEELNDDEYSTLSLRMTLCIGEKSGKKINFVCDFNDIKKCLANVEGDLWTTYVTFLQHIDNLCFYYKTLLWEKSSEFLYAKLVNNSMQVLNGLAESSYMAERILRIQEQLGSEVESNLKNSITNLKNFSDQIESFHKIEKSLKKDIVTIQENVKKSEDKFSNFAKFVDNKINFIYQVNSMFEYSNSLLQIDNFKFFLLTFLYIYFLTNFESTKSIRLLLILSLFIYFLSERHLILVFCNDMFYQYIMFYIVRLLYLIILFVLTIIKAYYYKSIERENNEHLIGLKYNFRNLCLETPNWMKKYFKKMTNHNQMLIEKYRRLNNFIQNDDNSVDKEDELN